MRARRQFFMDCHMAGRKHHDADLVWNELKVGTELQLELEPDQHKKSPPTLHRKAHQIYLINQYYFFSIGVYRPLRCIRANRLSRPS